MPKSSTLWEFTTYCNFIPYPSFMARTATKQPGTFILYKPYRLYRAGNEKVAGVRSLSYLFTYSMEQSPSWEANWFCS
jgi:hypothetical protein